MARPFGSPGSLTVNTPSLLERRQAVTDMAAVSNRESSLARRLFRQYSRASRKGDTDAGEKAMDLFDRANEKGIELGGIQSYDQRRNAAGADLTQRMRTNQELIDMEGGDTQAAPTASGAMTVTDQGWTPNETLATSPAQANEGIVGGPSGLPAEPYRSGPSPAEGGIMAARRNASTPIYSSRGIEQQSAPQSLDPNYGPPVGSASTPDREFAKKFPALSAFMKRAGDVKEYQLTDPGIVEKQEGKLGATSYLEEEVANYRFDESLDPEDTKRRMAKRAKTASTLSLMDVRSRQLEDGTSRIRRLPTPGATF